MPEITLPQGTIHYRDTGQGTAGGLLSTACWSTARCGAR